MYATIKGSSDGPEVLQFLSGFVSHSTLGTAIVPVGLLPLSFDPLSWGRKQFWETTQGMLSMGTPEARIEHNPAHQHQPSAAPVHRPEREMSVALFNNSNPMNIVYRDRL